MKKLFISLLFLGGFAHADWTTPNMGLTQPTTGINDNWGRKLNTNFRIIDSSAAILGGNNTFTGTNTFTTPPAFSSMTIFQLFIATPTYSGTEQLVVNGTSKFFATNGANLLLCDRNALNCQSITTDHASPSRGVIISTISATGAIILSNGTQIYEISTDAGLAIYTAGGGKINLRNSANNTSASIVNSGISNESQLELFADRIALEGPFPTSLRFVDVEHDNWVSFRSTMSLDHTQEYRLPSSTGAVDTVLSIDGIDSDGIVNLMWKTPAGGSGGSSALQITESGVQVTSPTASINFFGNDFNLAAIGSTSTVSLNPNTTNYIQNRDTLQTGATFYVSSGTVAGELNSNTMFVGVGKGTTSASGYSLTALGFNALQVGQTSVSPTNDTTNIRFFGYPNNATLGYLNYRHFTSGSFDGSGIQAGGFNLSDSRNNPIVYFNSAEGIKPSAFSDVTLHKGLILPTTSTLTLMDGNNSHFVAIRAPDVVTSTYTLKFPPADGTSGQALVTDGSGNLSFATAGSGASPYPAFVLVDSNTVTWVVSINTSGALVTTATTPASGSLKMNQIVFQDPSGAFWTTTITTSGALVTTAGGSYATAIQRIPVMDSNNLTWLLTVSNAGALTTS